MCGESPLLASVCEQRWSEARALVARRLHVATTKADKRSALSLLAMRNGPPALARMLVAAGVPVDARSDEGLTALHLAARYADAALVRELLGLGARADAVDALGNTAVMALACSDSPADLLAKLRLLLEAGADASRANADGSAPLHAASVKHGRDAGFLRALIQAGADPDALDGARCSPLTYAVVGGDLALDGVRALLDGGAAPDGRPVRGVRGGAAAAAPGAPVIPPLHFVASKGDSHVHVLRLFLGKGADANAAATHKRLTPLHALMRPALEDRDRPKTESLRALLDAGGDLLLGDDQGQTALHYACASAVPAGLLAEALRRAGREKPSRASDGVGRTLLHTAALNVGADAKTRVVLELTDCEPLQRDAAGLTAMDLAQSCFHMRALALLLRGTVDRAFVALMAAVEPRQGAAPGPAPHSSPPRPTPTRAAAQLPVTAFLHADGDHALMRRVRTMLLGG